MSCVLLSIQLSHPVVNPWDIDRARAFAGVPCPTEAADHGPRSHELVVVLGRFDLLLVLSEQVPLAGAEDNFVVNVVKTNRKTAQNGRSCANLREISSSLAPSPGPNSQKNVVFVHVEVFAVFRRFPVV